MSTPVTPLWQVEFPAFPVADLPAIPSDWVDQSWGNDVCPSFHTTGHDGRVARVFIDWADPSAREFPDSRRFTVLLAQDEYDDGAAVLDTDDWAEVLDTVAALTSRTADRDVNAVRVAARAFDPANGRYRVISRRAAAVIGLPADDCAAIVLSGLPNGPGEEPRP